MVNDGGLGSTQGTADFTSVLNNVNNVKTSDLLEFTLTLLFSSLYSHLKTIYRKFQDYENILEGESFLITLKRISGRGFFPFSPAALQNILEWLLSYDVTSYNS